MDVAVRVLCGLTVEEAARRTRSRHPGRGHAASAAAPARTRSGNGGRASRELLARPVISDRLSSSGSG
jgi:hypothetical protein